MDKEKDLYLNGEKIDPKIIKVIEGKIYLDGMAFGIEDDGSSREHPRCRCHIINGLIN